MKKHTLQVAVKEHRSPARGQISSGRSVLDSWLFEGSRVAAAFPPCNIGREHDPDVRRASLYSGGAFADRHNISGGGGASSIGDLRAKNNLVKGDDRQIDRSATSDRGD